MTNTINKNHLPHKKQEEKVHIHWVVQSHKSTYESVYMKYGKHNFDEKGMILKSLLQGVKQ